jgi:hypothetical protein
MPQLLNAPWLGNKKGKSYPDQSDLKQRKYVSNFLSVTLKALQTKINLRGVSTDIWLDAHTMLYNYK